MLRQVLSQAKVCLLLSLAPIQPRGHILSQHPNLGGGNNLAITQAITTKEHHPQSNLEPPNAFERIILPAAKKKMKASNGFIRKIELLQNPLQEELKWRQAVQSEQS